MAEEVILEEKKPGKVGSKFHVYGKYFLFVIIFLVQAIVAYAVVDKNYARLYQMLASNSSDQFTVYKMDELIVNPARSNGQRYLVVEISMELDHQRDVELINLHLQRIKHSMNEALAMRTVDQLMQFQERERLRFELKNIVNREIGHHSVRNLYYTKYVMQ